MSGEVRFQEVLDEVGADNFENESRRLILNAVQAGKIRDHMQVLWPQKSVKTVRRTVRHVTVANAEEPALFASQASHTIKLVRGHPASFALLEYQTA